MGKHSPPAMILVEVVELVEHKHWRTHATGDVERDGTGRPIPASLQLAVSA